MEVRTRMPFLPAHLEDSADGKGDDWNAQALESLAKQLTVANDFYYPLIGAAEELRSLRRVRDGLVEVLRMVNPFVQPHP